MIERRNRKLLVGLGLLGLTAAVPVWAHGFGGPEGGSGFGRPGRGPGGGVLERLISPCRAACGDTAKSCGEAAEATAVTCAQNSCAGDVSAAQSACAADHTSDACHGAVRQLHDCIAAPCLEPLHASLSACRDALGTCREGCATAQ